jgi:exopolysaccharide biosynthesis polyprenyl glycosylphosphotransferase
MINQRSRGLVNLHAALMTLVATLLFAAYANVAGSHWLLPVVDLGPDLALMSYGMCVVGGMLLSSRDRQVFSSRFDQVSWVDAARIATRQVGFVAVLIFTLMFAAKDRGISRVFLSTYLALWWLLGLFLNRALPRMLARMMFEGHQRIPTLFVGSSAQIARLESWLANKGGLGIEAVGILTEEGTKPGGSGFPFLGGIHDLARVIEQKSVAQVIVLAIPTTREAGRILIETCQEKGCRLLIYSNLAELLDHPLVLVREDAHSFYSLQDEPLEDPFNRVLKRAFDIAVSLPVVIFLLPPLCVWVWLMQRLQAPGALFFVQARSGRRSRAFNLFKFRSMFDAKREAAVEARQARKDDDRVYAFGRFIRRTSLDEFPQFFNVLRGDMSIVGPRPHMLAHDEQFSRFYKGYRTRHFAKPGITGLAQVRGFRGEITDPDLLRERVQNDLHYISNWSIWLDLQITLKTFWQVIFSPPSAY